MSIGRSRLEARVCNNSQDRQRGSIFMILVHSSTYLCFDHPVHKNLTDSLASASKKGTCPKSDGRIFDCGIPSMDGQAMQWE